MKWLLVLLFPVSVSAQVTDTTSQMVYYQKSLIKKGKIELYGYVSYDLNWASESGIGITLTIPSKRKKKKK
jgi:hypothetical protein